MITGPKISSWTCRSPCRKATDDRRLDVEALVALTFPAGRQNRVLGNLQEEAQHPLQLVGIADRRHPGVLVVDGPAERGQGTGRLFGQCRGEFVGDARLGQHAGCGVQSCPALK